MGKIVVHEFISLDGVIEDPAWTFEFGYDPKFGEDIGGIMSSCEAILLGRKTYTMFEPAWSKRTAAEDPGAPFMNESRKYVVTRTLKNTTWNNTEVVDGYNADAIRALKEHHQKNLYVSGSGTLVRAMLADGLVDELQLFVYPVALGKGGRLFTDHGEKSKFTLASCDAYTNGVVHLAYSAAQ
jgi:dihydrofolate reductase